VWLQAGAPLWLCDATCTVPSVLLGAAALRGGNAAFLRASKAPREERLAAGWLPPPAPPPPCAPPAPPPAWHVDLQPEVRGACAHRTCAVPVPVPVPVPVHVQGA
jgi:hypothetical protein